jgi:hypothetical protein
MTVALIAVALLAGIGGTLFLRSRWRRRTVVSREGTAAQRIERAREADRRAAEKARREREESSDLD